MPIKGARRPPLSVFHLTTNAAPLSPSSHRKSSIFPCRYPSVTAADSVTVSGAPLTLSTPSSSSFHILPSVHVAFVGALQYRRRNVDRISTIAFVLAADHHYPSRLPVTLSLSLFRPSPSTVVRPNVDDPWSPCTTAIAKFVTAVPWPQATYDCVVRPGGLRSPSSCPCAHHLPRSNNRAPLPSSTLLPFIYFNSREYS